MSKTFSGLHNAITKLKILLYFSPFFRFYSFYLSTYFIKIIKISPFNSLACCSFPFLTCFVSRYIKLINHPLLRYTKLSSSFCGYCLGNQAIAHYIMLFLHCVTEALNWEDEIYDESLVERTAHGFKTFVSVPSALVKFVIGKKWETKKKIEKETNCQIQIPKMGQEGAIGY